MALPEKKMICLENWLNNPFLTYEKIAEMSNVSDKTFWNYRQEEEFMREYRERCQKRFAELEAKAIESLKNQIEENQFQATKYLLDSVGYKPTEKVEADVKGTITINIGYDDEL